MSLMKLGLVRGLVGQSLGILAGMFTIMLGRLAMGMSLADTESYWVMGMHFGSIGFMLGVGTMDDWIEWWKGRHTPFRHGAPVGAPAWTRYFGVDYNHKVIGIQYGITGLIMLCIGGSFAVGFRTELARVGLQFLNENTYNTFISQSNQ